MKRERQSVFFAPCERKMEITGKGGEESRLDWAGDRGRKGKSNRPLCFSRRGFRKGKEDLTTPLQSGSGREGGKKGESALYELRTRPEKDEEVEWDEILSHEEPLGERDINEGREERRER